MRTATSNGKSRVAAILVALALLGGMLLAPIFTAKAAAVDSIYSPGDSGQYTINGRIVLDREGLAVITNGADEQLNDVKVYVQWIDRDGAVSPVYFDTSRIISGEDGNFSVYLPPWTDVNGVTHTFNADAYERLKVWIENPDPDKYHLAYEESQGILGTWTKRDAAGWNVVANNVINWVIALQLNPQDYLFKPQTEWRPSTATGTNANLYGTFSGRLWLDYQHTWGATAYPQYDPLPKDVPQEGITMVGSYLTDAGVAAMEAWKSANPGYTAAQYEAFTAETLTAHPEYIAETVTAVTNAQGNYHLQFNGLDRATGLAADSEWTIWNTTQRKINTNYIYIAPLLPDGMQYISPFQNPVFQSAYEPAVPSAMTVNAGASMLNFPLYYGNPTFDVVEYNTTSNRQRPVTSSRPTPPVRCPAVATRSFGVTRPAPRWDAALSWWQPATHAAVLPIHGAGRPDHRQDLHRRTDRFDRQCGGR